MIETIEKKELTPEEKFDALTFCDDYMFGAVLYQYPEITKSILEEILQKKISKIEYPDVQKEMRPGYTSRGVRLDVYVEDDENSVYNIEMQNDKISYLPKRSRYYQIGIDSDQLKRGMDYTSLKDSYIIFFCKYDPFERGRYIYTFEGICAEENDLKLNDGTKRIFLSTEGTHGFISKELENLLKYMKDSSKDEGKIVKEIASGIKEIKKDERRRAEFMTIEEKMREREMLAEERGMRIGEERGMRIGENEDFIPKSANNTCNFNGFVLN